MNQQIERAVKADFGAVARLHAFGEGRFAEVYDGVALFGGSGDWDGYPGGA